MSRDQLALGTVQFGLDYGVTNSRGKIPLHEVEAILAEAQVAGIGILDTAAAYGDSENTIGQIGAANSFRVVTKINVEHAVQVEAAVKASAERLRAEALDTVLLHHGGVLANDPSIWDHMHRLAESRLVRRIGISVYEPEEVDSAIDLAERRRLLPPQTIQIPLNIFDQRFLPYLFGWKDRGIEIHARSLYLQGAAFFDQETAPEYLSGLRGSLGRLAALVADLHTSRAAVLLAFGLMQPVDALVIGVDSLETLRATIAAYDEAWRVKQKIESEKRIVDAFRDLVVHDPAVIIPSNWAKSR